MYIYWVLIKAQESVPMAFKKGKTPELPGALPPGPPPGHCPWTPPGALRRARDGSCATARSTWVSPAASTFLTGILSKMMGNFKILAKALIITSTKALNSTAVKQFPDIWSRRMNGVRISYKPHKYQRGFKGVLQLLPQISMFFVLSKNNQHLLEK